MKHYFSHTKRNNLPPGWTVKIFNLFPVPLEDGSKIAPCIFTLKNWKHNYVLGRVWFRNIGNLELHFRRALPMISTKFYVHHVVWYATWMPCQDLSSINGNKPKQKRVKWNIQLKETRYRKKKPQVCQISLVTFVDVGDHFAFQVHHIGCRCWFCHCCHFVATLLSVFQWKHLLLKVLLL